MRYGKFPCVRCNRFACALGEAHCESCQADDDGAAELIEFGHTARWCPQRIDVSTSYAEEAYVHGPCREKDNIPEEKQVPEIDFTFTSGGREYHVKGNMQTIDKKGVGYSPSGTEQITITLWGSVEQHEVHSTPHMKRDTKHGDICLCKCGKCSSATTRKCVCTGCDCRYNR